jgi:hypothetical protein
MPGAPDPLYIAATRALLDALEALGVQRNSVVLVGAQAIYIITGEGDLAVSPFTIDADLVLAVSPFTTDADLALDPRRLQPERLRVMTIRMHLMCSDYFAQLAPEIWSHASRRVREAGVSAQVTDQGIQLLQELFGAPHADGSQMAARATAGLEDPDVIAASCAALATDILEALSSRS